MNIEDFGAFNKEYAKGLQEKNQEDNQVYVKIENLLTSFHEKLSKFDMPSSNSFSQDQITPMVSSMEKSFKAKLTPILDIVLRLPTNAPYYMHS